MFAGLEKSVGDYCVIMDADLQHPPKLLAPMYQAVSQEGYDCCAGKGWIMKEKVLYVIF